MKLYEASNGYYGNGPVRITIVAESESRARELATEALKESAKSIRWNGEWDGKYRYDSAYWESVAVVLLSDDLAKEYVGEVEE